VRQLAALGSQASGVEEPSGEHHFLVEFGEERLADRHKAFKKIIDERLIGGA